MQKRPVSIYDWVPHAGQAMMLKWMPLKRYIVAACGRRFGKTEMVVVNKIRRAWDDPGDYVYIAPTFKQAKRIAWRKLKRMFPDNMKMKRWKNESELWVENRRGGRILLLGAEDFDNLRGEGWKGATVDEFADINPSIFDLVIRPALSDHRGWCHFIGTPKGYDHLYEWFIRDKENHNANYTDAFGNSIRPNDNVKSFQFITADNPLIHRREIQEAYEIMPTELFKQEFLASFENYAGLVYREWMEVKDERTLKPIFDEQQRVVGFYRFGIPQKLESWWEYYIGIDTGRVSAAIIKAVDQYGNEYIIDEVYDIDGLVKDIASQIKHKTSHLLIKGKVIDSASQVKREYENQGYFCTDSVKDPLGAVDIIRRKDKEGKTFVLANCKSYLKEKSSRRWNEKSKIKREPIKADDHAINAEDYIQTTFLAIQPDDLGYWMKRIKSEEDKRLDKSSLDARVKRNDNKINYDDLA